MPENEKPEHYILLGPEASGRPKIVLVGCGGAGCNLIAEGGVNHVSIALSSEPEVLKGLKVQHKVLVNARGLEQDARAGVKGSKLAGTETGKKLGELLSKMDIAFIVAGLGGCTGGWGAVLAARAARRQGCISICVVSEPFSVEGRGDRASEQLRLLMEHADAVLVLPNDMIISEAPNLPIARAFMVMNAVLASPIDLLSSCVGKDDIDTLEDCLKAGRIFAMDVAEWDGPNAAFSVAEQLGRSKWLDLDGRVVRSAILLAEGQLLHDDLVELGREFSRVIGREAELVLGNAGSGDSLKLTAIIGY